MKKLVLICILLTCAGFTAYAQQQTVAPAGGITWYTIEYDTDDNEISYTETLATEYGAPVLIKGVFPGTETAASAIITIFDDTGNKIFEDTKEINNGVFEGRYVLRTTRKRLMELQETDSLRFVCEIDNGTQRLRSAFIETAFVYTISFAMPRTDLPDARFIVASTDALYRTTRNPVNDIEQSGWRLVLKFRNIIPGKAYTLSRLQKGVRGWDPATEKFGKSVNEWERQFHELFMTID